MNKLLTKIVGVALGATMAIGVGVAVANSDRGAIKADAASTTTNFTLSSASTVSKEGVTVSFAKGSGSTAPTWYAAGLRLYINNTVTITCSQSITGVSFDWEKQGSKTFITGCTANTGTYTHPSSAGTGTWTGSATSITFSLGGSGAQLQLNTFSVTHESVSISYATAIAIDQNTSSLDVGDTLSLSATLTPSAPTDSSISWSSDDTEVLRVSSTGVVKAVGEGTATITANANGAQVANSVQDTLEITTSVDGSYDYCDVLTSTTIGVESTQYTAWSSTVSASNSSASSAEYDGKTARNTTGPSIQINKDSGNGIIVSTSGGLAKKVVVVWASNNAEGRVFRIYGSNNAISLSNMGSITESITYGTSTEAELNGGNGYRYLGFGADNAAYLESIIVYWDESGSASLDLSGNTSATVGDSVVYTATRNNSSATIDWYVDSAKQNSGISVSGDTSTFTYSASAAGTFEIKAQLNGTEVYQTKSLVVSAVEKYTLVTDLSQLTVGNKVLVAATHSDTTYVAKAYSSGNNVKTTTASVTNNQITKTADMSALTLGATSDGYTLFDESNYYWYAASTTSNYLKGQASAGNHAYFTISLSAGTFTVQATNNSDRGTMLLNYNNGSPVFSCYSSSTSGDSYETVDLYVLDTNPSANSKLLTYGKLFLHSVDIALVTEETGVEGTACVDNGYYTKAKAALATSGGVWSSVKSTLQSDSTGLKLRYEAWARAAGDATPYDGEAGIQSSRTMFNNIISDSNGAVAVIVIISMVTLTAVGGYFFMRKKKEQ